MIVRLVNLLASIFAAVVLTTSRTQTVRAMSPDDAIATDVKTFVANLAAADKFSGVVLVSRNDHLLFNGGYGFANRSTRQRNTPETPFMLSSVGKLFTTAVVAKLIERNQLSFDTQLGEILPDYPSADARRRVRVRDLLTMTSGIRDLFKVPAFWAEISSIKSPTDFWKYFAESPLEFVPGTKWSYSNSNFLLLGLMIERVIKRPFTDVVEQEVFRPLGLTHTRYRFQGGPKPAMGYTRQPPNQKATSVDGWYPAWEEPMSGEDFLVAVPMGGGYSTATDLARFMDGFANGRVVNRSLAARMLTGYIEADYGGRDGYGFETRTVNGVRIVGHRGSLAGSSNEVEFYPDLGYAVVVLGNSDGSAQDIAAHVRALLTSSRR